MPDEGLAPQPGDREALIRSAIRNWRDGLINLTGSNRLLNFKPSRTGSVELVRPSSGEVLARLTGHGTYQFRALKPKKAETQPASSVDAGTGSPLEAGTRPDLPNETQVERADDAAVPAADEAHPLPPPSPDTLDADTDPDDLASALRSLYRRSTQEYLDRGVSILYLAFGTLSWTDEDRSRYTSPLLLVPVRLEHKGPRQLPTLAALEEDRVLNPALALKLAQRGIDLPRADDSDEVTLASVLDAIRAVVAAQDGWQVSETLLLSCFSFAKDAMYRDLLDHEDLIAAHPSIAALAAGGRGAESSGFFFDELPDQDVDRRAAPESTPVILDADSSQRASIAAALDGRSFVMDGPPGTGKSQTIANMIGVLLNAGKTVLFVSEKAAALDVVRDRLDVAGLRAYLLELHSHKATRKQVAVALGEALDNVPVAPAPMPAIDVDAARKRREQLNSYADAMNRVREPLGCSLHDVFGMIAQLHEVPAAPVASIAPVNLTVDQFGEIRRTAAKLAGAWRPAVQGRSFVWRGVTEKGSLDSLVYQARSSLEMLAGIAQVNRTFADTAGLTRPSDASALADLLAHLTARPAELPPDWLTVSSLDAVDAALAQLADQLAQIAAREAEVTHAAGASWAAVPQSDVLPEPGNQALSVLVPPAVEIDGLPAVRITALATAFAAEADMLEKRLGGLAGLASMLSLRTPATFGDADDLLALATLTQEPGRPERAWLSASGLASARQAERTLDAAQQSLARAEADASAYYTPAALGHDVEGLARRFESEHHRLGKLSGEYRADKKAVAAFTKDDVGKDEAHRFLGLAVAWKQAAEELATAERAHAPILGTYYSGASTDFSRLNGVLEVAATAVRRARGQDLSGFADCAAPDVPPNRVIAKAADEISRDLNGWKATLAFGQTASAPPDLLGGSIRDAIGWLRAHLGPLGAAAAFTQAVSDAAGRPLNAGQARHLVSLRDAAAAAHERLAALAGQFSDTFGDLYAGDRTDIADMSSSRRSAPPGTASTSASAIPSTPASTRSGSSATGTSTTHPGSRGTGTGCGRRSCGGSAGTCTASGGPPGTGTAMAKKPSSVPLSSRPSRPRSMAC